jgi:histidyl-tRNA synthetase
MASSQYRPLQGMTDLSVPDTHLWHHLETRARDVLTAYGFDEVRTPILEKAGLFLHSLGETSDVVSKEMYTVSTPSGKTLALRPEGTAGAVRFAAGLGEEGAGARLFYMGPMFRRERPQAGRRRQFHQVGIEALGPPNPAADAEAIALQVDLLAAWGLEGGAIRLNTLGRPAERAGVLAGLREAIRPRLGDLPEDARERFHGNVLRLLDSKDETVQQALAEIPPITAFMDEASRAYLDEVRSLLRDWGIEAAADPRLVRGLDYYAHTVWEVTHGGLGAQDALSGGGRYTIDLDGRPVEGVGFAIGVERVIAALASAGIGPEQFAPPPPVFLVSLGEAALRANWILARALRRAGVAARTGLEPRSMKAQMRAANRVGARIVYIRGDAELEKGVLLRKDMAAGTQEEIEEQALLRKSTHHHERE